MSTRTTILRPVVKQFLPSCPHFLDFLRHGPIVAGGDRPQSQA